MIWDIKFLFLCFDFLLMLMILGFLVICFLSFVIFFVCVLGMGFESLLLLILLGFLLLFFFVFDCVLVFFCKFGCFVVILNFWYKKEIFFDFYIWNNIYGIFFVLVVIFFFKNMVWFYYYVNFEFDVNILGCCVNVFLFFWLCEVIYNGNKFWNFV